MNKLDDQLEGQKIVYLDNVEVLLIREDVSRLMSLCFLIYVQIR